MVSCPASSHRAVDGAPLGPQQQVPSAGRSSAEAMKVSDSPGAGRSASTTRPPPGTESQFRWSGVPSAKPSPTTTRPKGEGRDDGLFTTARPPAVLSYTLSSTLTPPPAPVAVTCTEVTPSGTT